MQGVWFRDSTRREAESAGSTGYAKNLVNGDVEVMASGSDDALNELQRWLQNGPPLARVDELIVQQLDYEVFSAFEIR